MRATSAGASPTSISRAVMNGNAAPVTSSRVTSAKASRDLGPKIAANGGQIAHQPAALGQHRCELDPAHGGQPRREQPVERRLGARPRELEPAEGSCVEHTGTASSRAAFGSDRTEGIGTPQTRPASTHSGKRCGSAASRTRWLYRWCRLWLRAGRTERHRVRTRRHRARRLFKSDGVQSIVWHADRSEGGR
jgi:hypothetical protein